MRDDPGLHALYKDDIPVLLLRGEEVVRHRVTETDLRTRLLALGVAPTYADESSR